MVKTENKIRLFRESRGISREELAEALNVSRQTVSKWERGVRPSADNLLRLSQVYGVSLDRLLHPLNTTSGSINRSIRVSETGQYLIAIRNNEDYAVTVTGTVEC